MVKHLDVPFDSEILEFYKNEGIVGLDNDSDFKKYMLRKLSIYMGKFKDKKIRKHIPYLYNQLKTHIGGLNCVVLDNAVNSFEKYLQRNTRESYKIKLIVDGNL